MPRWVLSATVIVLLAFPRDALAQRPSDITKQIQEADRFAWVTNWYDALPFYQRAEQDAMKAGNRRDAMYAKFGRLRAQMQTMSLADISEELAQDLDSAVARRDARLRLRGLTIKGDIDLEWDVQAARHDWEQVRALAKELGDKGWENRATGELGLVAFLLGNTGQATTRVQQALQVAVQSGDVGGQLRYMGAIANGVLMAGNPQLATEYADRALKLANENPETGFPFVVYATKVLTFLALNQPDEAERFARAAMVEARAGDRRIKEVELLMTLAQIAQKRGRQDQAVQHLEQASVTARTGHVQRLLADAEAGLADAYRARGDLDRARRHAVAAVDATEASGSRFTLPVRLGVLADIHATQGDVAEADRVYEQAADVVEGIMINVPSRDAQARLIGVMSDIYAGHFRLAAERLANPARAYEIIERARGRALADVLRTLPDGDRPVTDAVSRQLRVVSQLQVRLMRARSASQRKETLDQLWDAEQRMTLQNARSRSGLPIAPARAGLRAIQRTLKPNEVILEYVVTEPRSYCLVISANGAKLVALPSRKRIDDLIDSFVSELRGRTRGQSAAARALYEAVLLPTAAQGQMPQRLILVPDGKLHLLPFDSLLTMNAVQGRVTSIAPSANVFFLLRTQPQRVSADRPLLAIGGVPYDRLFGVAPTNVAKNRSADTRGLYDGSFPSNLPVLATAQEEVLAAVRVLGAGSVALTGEHATESGLKAQDLQSFRILHFAVHAFADPKFPERAALVLLNDPTGAEDGLLQPREIGRLRLNASVIVLSACDTSVGPTIGQEGVQNLARAFLIAGAQTVVTTLWAVSDAVSIALMRAFYENIVAGQDIAEALARAKSVVIQQLGPEALPTVSAFQVVGLGDHRMTAKGAPQRLSTNDQRR